MSDLKQSTLTIGNRVFELPKFADIVAFRTVEGNVTIDFSGVSSVDREARNVRLESELLAGSRGNEAGVRTITLSNRGSGAQDLPGGQRVAIELDEPIAGLRRNEEGRKEYWENPRWFRA